MPRHYFPAGKVFAVWCQLNGEDYNLVFDPGAQYISLTRRVIERLELLPTARTSSLISANATEVTEQRPIYEIASVTAFGLTAHAVEAIEISLPSQVDFHGLLGVSFLQHFRFTADYGEGWIDIVGRASA